MENGSARLDRCQDGINTYSVSFERGWRKSPDFHVQIGDPEKELKAVGNGAGSANRRWSTAGQPTKPPFIRFTPQTPD